MSFNGYSLGIMQGRLTEPKGRGIQFFPFENWENEFSSAAELGLDEVEFIFDYERYEENPLYTSDGQSRINTAVKNSGVVVNSVCFDYFMRRPFYKAHKSDATLLRAENIKFSEKIISACENIGASILEIPAVDDSSVKTETERALFIEFLRETAAGTHITINIESDLGPENFKKLLSDVGLSNVKANYDSGNSSGLGYDHYEEITVLGDYVTNVHIKDRKLGGLTMPLGQGDADFNALFSALRETNYNGSFVLQAARGDDGCETKAIAEQLSFVKRYIANI